MYQGLLHAHSGLRWIVLILIIINVINAIGKMNGKQAFTQKDKKLSFFALISTHLQAVLGLILYWMSPKVEFNENTMSNPIFRYFYHGAHTHDADRYHPRDHRQSLGQTRECKESVLVLLHRISTYPGCYSLAIQSDLGR